MPMTWFTEQVVVLAVFICLSALTRDANSASRNALLGGSGRKQEGPTSGRNYRIGTALKSGGWRHEFLTARKMLGPARIGTSVPGDNSEKMRRSRVVSSYARKEGETGNVESASSSSSRPSMLRRRRGDWGYNVDPAYERESHQLDVDAMAAANRCLQIPEKRGRLDSTTLGQGKQREEARGQKIIRSVMVNHMSAEKMRITGLGPRFEEVRKLYRATNTTSSYMNAYQHMLHIRAMQPFGLSHGHIGFYPSQAFKYYWVTRVLTMSRVLRGLGPPRICEVGFGSGIE